MGSPCMARWWKCIAALSMYELDMSLYAPLCCQLLFFSPAVHRTTSGEGEMFSLRPCFKLILTLCYYFYGFLRELDLAFGRSPDRDEALPFHGQTRWVKFNDLAPHIHDAMERWALGPHVILVKVISVCGLHVFFHQYEVALRVHSQLLVRRRSGQLGHRPTVITLRRSLWCVHTRGWRF